MTKSFTKAYLAKKGALCLSAMFRDKNIEMNFLLRSVLDFAILMT